MNVLCALNEKDSEDAYIVAEFAAIKDSALVMQQGGFRDLFTMDEDRNFHRVVLAYVNQCFQQISGINLITYYAANIYETSIQLSPFLSRILAAANGTEYFAASWIAVFTIEKFGRRQLMLFGAAGQAASMAVLAGCTSRTSSGLGITAAVFLFVFNTFFAIGWLGMTWLYPAEIVPLYHAFVLTLLQHGRHDYPCRFRDHRISNLHYLRGHQRLHRPLCLLLLPW
jgi:hypothetical protein